MHESSRSKWKCNNLTDIDDKTLELSRQIRCRTSSIVREHCPNNNLKDIFSKYIITPIDKTINDAAFSHGRFWLKNSDTSLTLIVAHLKPNTKIFQTLFLKHPSYEGSHAPTHPSLPFFQLSSKLKSDG